MSKLTLIPSSHITISLLNPINSKIETSPWDKKKSVADAAKKVLREGALPSD